MVDTLLEQLIAEESRNELFPSAAAMVDHLKSEYGSTVRGMVFYGSCLRLGTDHDLMLDFYVLVDSLFDALEHPVSAAFGTLVPPNVYYHEIRFEDRTVRAKVAVMTLGAFVRATDRSTFASAIWARFSQPAAIVYASDNVAEDALERALARAVKTMVGATLPLLKGPFTTRDLWVTALRATYGAELRPESKSKADALVDADLERYDSIGMAALTELGIDPFSPRFPKPAARWVWRARGIWGRILNILRLIKAAFTFKGGLDYAVWKMNRHADEPIELSDADRARPLRTGLRLLFRSMRKQR